MSDAPDQPKEPPPRAVTWRSLGLGLAGVAFIALYSDFNNQVVKPGPPLVGNHLPVGPIAIALLAAAVWNPLAGRLWRGLRFNARELAVAMVLMLVTAWIPGYGVYRSFAIQLVRPWLVEKEHPDWQNQHTFERLPPHLFPLRHDRDDPAYGVVYGDFEAGIPRGSKPLPPAKAPWRPWLAVMAWWGSLFGLLGLAFCALAALVHRQWSKHEQLAYPLASVFTALMPEPGGGIPSVLKSRLFWIGTIPPAIFFLNNWLAIMTSESKWIHFPWITHVFFVNEWKQLFPVLNHIDYNPIGFIQFITIGIAYFVPTEVSFSMAFGYTVYAIIAAQWYLATGSAMSGPDRKSTVAGAYVAYGVILLVTGRTYYWATLRGAFARLRAGEYDPQGVWAARILLVSAIAIVWLLAAGFGFDWLVAAIYVGAVLLFFLVVSRAVCETGIPFMQAEWDMGMVMANGLGFPFLGPASLVPVLWLGSIINFDTRVCALPFAANGLKLAENVGLRLPPLVPAALVALALALTLGFAAQIYDTYAYGAKRDDYHVLQAQTAETGNQATTGLTTLVETGLMSPAEAAHGLGKIPLVGSNIGHGRQVGWMAFGALGVIAFTLARFRFSWFPLHPVVFLFWATWPQQFLWFGFFLGWAIKTAVVKYGGARWYHALKPLFLGLILGETMIEAFFLVTQLVYYVITGQPKGSGYAGG